MDIKPGEACDGDPAGEAEGTAGKGYGGALAAVWRADGDAWWVSRGAWAGLLGCSGPLVPAVYVFIEPLEGKITKRLCLIPVPGVKNWVRSEFTPVLAGLQTTCDLLTLT